MRARWQFHQGEDYAVVMLPGETTDTASVRIYGEHAAEIGKMVEATPDLLAILTSFIEIWSKGGPDYTKRMEDYWGYDNLSKARAAIAKAKGEGQ